MPEVKIRLRHPGGVTTLDVDPDTTTIGELKMMIFSTAEIAPGEQEVKYGYPPKLLPDGDDQILSSVPITKGEQIVVARVAGRAETSQTTSRATEANAASLQATREAPSATQAQASSSSAAATIEIPMSGGQILQHVVVPDDNSCLFNSLGVVFKRNATELRQVIARKLEENPIDYPDVVLGMPRASYIQKILQPNTWGGAIELAIFADYFRTEIASFDVQSGRVDRFGEGQHDSRCILVYSGIHYDAIVAAPMADAPVDFCTTLFPATDDLVLSCASQLVAQLKARHYYTDTQNFDLRCQVCKVGLKGEKGAREHAMQTGHVDFGEY